MQCDADSLSRTRLLATFAITFIFCISREAHMAIKGDFGVVRSLHAKSRFLKIVSVRRYDSESFVGEQTRGNTC